MTSQPEKTPAKMSLAAVLPWLLAGALLALYLLTLNRWVSVGSLWLTARASGDFWLPTLQEPLFYLVTFPFHWVREPWLPLSLNLFSVGCATLTLVLLARSVMLLPHDRTQEQREREHSAFATLSLRTAWIPPVLAVLVCGLQLTFWEHATAASSEMFNLLLFAYVVRCCLEFRVGGRDSWLTRAALVFGASMANNWAMVGLFPLFLAAIVWLKGLEFFNARFLRRMALCGAIGLLFYLVLPLINVSSDIGFWQALKFNLIQQEQMLWPLWKHHRGILFLLGLTSLLPLFVISIRWESYFGDSSLMGMALATWVFHLVHAFFLVICIWVAFDPAFAPRLKAEAVRLNGPVYFLPAYYVSALVIGYLSGYFLLIFAPYKNRLRYNTPSQLSLRKVSTAGVAVLLVIAPAGLFYTNLPKIKMTNGPALRQYTSLLAQNLPQRAVVLSDDPRKLSLLESALAGIGRASDYVFLDTRSLPWLGYHRFLHEKYPSRWQGPAKDEKTLRYGDLAIANLMLAVSETNLIYYLHPSFGYYFEHFYPEPHGLVYALKRYPTNATDALSISPPPLTDAQIGENEAFWTQADATVLQPLLPAIAPPPSDAEPSGRQKLMTALHLPFRANETAANLGKFYSLALNHWGVEAQKAGRLETANAHFRRASELDPDNIVAREVNLPFNENLRAGNHASIQVSQSVQDRFGKYRGWDQVIGINGLFDEPTFCFALGQTFAQGGLRRQAAQQFHRASVLAPESLLARLWVARLYVANQMPDAALALLDEIRSRLADFQDAGTSPFEIPLVEALALYAKNDPHKAGQLLTQTMEKHPTNAIVLAAVTQLWTAVGDYSNALSAVERELRLKPQNPNALINQGYLCLQLGKYDDSIQSLSRALDLQATNHPARWNRAIAYLRSDQLDEARQDYQALESVFTNAFQIHYGLGEIAWRKQETNTAIHYYELYLANAITNSEEARFISDRLKQLQGGSP